MSYPVRLPARSGRPEGEYEFDKASDMSEKSGTIFLVICFIKVICYLKSKLFFVKLENIEKIREKSV